MCTCLPEPEHAARTYGDVLPSMKLEYPLLLVLSRRRIPSNAYTYSVIRFVFVILRTSLLASRSLVFRMHVYRSL